MNRNVDLVEGAKIFEASVVFVNAFSALNTLISEREISDSGSENLRQAGEIFCAMDWRCSDHESIGRRVDRGLATSIRPEFYSALLRTNFPYPHSPDIEFRDRFYRTLESGGVDILVSDEELGWGIKLTGELSKTFLNRFQHSHSEYSSKVE